MQADEQHTKNQPSTRKSEQKARSMRHLLPHKQKTNDSENVNPEAVWSSQAQNQGSNRIEVNMQQPLISPRQLAARLVRPQRTLKVQDLTGAHLSTVHPTLAPSQDYSSGNLHFGGGNLARDAQANSVAIWPFNQRQSNLERVIQANLQVAKDGSVYKTNCSVTRDRHGNRAACSLQVARDNNSLECHQQVNRIPSEPSQEVRFVADDATRPPCDASGLTLVKRPRTQRQPKQSPEKRRANQRQQVQGTLNVATVELVGSSNSGSQRAASSHVAGSTNQQTYREGGESSGHGNAGADASNAAQPPSQLTVLQQDAVLTGAMDYGFSQGIVRQGNLRSPRQLRAADEQEVARSLGIDLANSRQDSYEYQRTYATMMPAISAVVPPVVAAAMVAHKLPYMVDVPMEVPPSGHKEDNHLRINLAQVEQDNQQMYPSSGAGGVGKDKSLASSSQSGSDSPNHHVHRLGGSPQGRKTIVKLSSSSQITQVNQAQQERANIERRASKNKMPFLQYMMRKNSSQVKQQQLVEPNRNLSGSLNLEAIAGLTAGKYPDSSPMQRLSNAMELQVEQILSARRSQKHKSNSNDSLKSSTSSSRSHIRRRKMKKNRGTSRKNKKENIEKQPLAPMLMNSDRQHEEELQIKIRADMQDLAQRINQINDTICICYYASRNGLQYRQIVADGSPEDVKKKPQAANNENEHSEVESANQSDALKEQLVDRTQKQSNEENAGIHVPNLQMKEGFKTILGKTFQSNMTQGLGMSPGLRNALKHHCLKNDDVYSKMRETKRKITRGTVGPKAVNKYDRQLIEQFMSRSKDQNKQNIQSIMHLNRDMHKLLRGANAPKEIYEEEHEQSRSLISSSSLEIGVYNRMLQREHNSGLLPMASFNSSSVAPSQYQASQFWQQQSRANQNMQDTRSNLSPMNSQFGARISNYDLLSHFNPSNAGGRAADDFSDLSSLKIPHSRIHTKRAEKSPRVLIIVNNDKDTTNKGNAVANLSPEQIQHILKEYNRMEKENKSASATDPNKVKVFGVNVERDQSGESLVAIHKLNADLDGTSRHRGHVRRGSWKSSARRSDLSSINMENDEQRSYYLEDMDGMQEALMIHQAMEKRKQDDLSDGGLKKVRSRSKTQQLTSSEDSLNESLGSSVDEQSGINRDRPKKKTTSSKQIDKSAQKAQADLLSARQENRDIKIIVDNSSQNSSSGLLSVKRLQAKASQKKLKKILQRAASGEDQNYLQLEYQHGEKDEVMSEMQGDEDQKQRGKQISNRLLKYTKSRELETVDEENANSQDKSQSMKTGTAAFNKLASATQSNFDDISYSNLLSNNHIAKSSEMMKDRNAGESSSTLNKNSKKNVSNSDFQSMSGSKVSKINDTEERLAESQPAEQTFRVKKMETPKKARVLKRGKTMNENDEEHRTRFLRKEKYEEKDKTSVVSPNPLLSAFSQTLIKDLQDKSMKGSSKTMPQIVPVEDSQQDKSSKASDSKNRLSKFAARTFEEQKSESKLQDEKSPSSDKSSKSDGGIVSATQIKMTFDREVHSPEMSPRSVPQDARKMGDTVVSTPSLSVDEDLGVEIEHEEDKKLEACKITTMTLGKSLDSSFIKYSFDKRERRLLQRVLKMMRPPHWNRIKQKLQSVKTEVKDKAVFKALSRLAFERDPERQLSVTLLDYNSLDQRYGVITFVDGMTKVAFRGTSFKRRQIDQDQEQQEQQTSCITAVFSRLQRQFELIDLANTSTDSIKVSTIEGIIFGPHSTTFKQYLREAIRSDEVMKHRYDQWRYITFVTPLRTYDFILDNMTDSMDLIMAMEEAILSYKREVIRKNIQSIEQGTNAKYLKHEAKLKAHMKNLEENGGTLKQSSDDFDELVTRKPQTPKKAALSILMRRLNEARATEQRINTYRAGNDEGSKELAEQAAKGSHVRNRSDAAPGMFQGFWGAVTGSIFAQKDPLADELNRYKLELIENEKHVLSLCEQQAQRIGTNQRLLRFEMTRLKIKSIAEHSGYSLAQYLMLAVFKTVMDQEERDIEDRYKSLTRLLKIIKRCDRLSDLTEVLDMVRYRQIERDYNKHALMQIARMTPRRKQAAMIEFVRRANAAGDPDSSGSENSVSSRHEEIKVEHIREPSIVLSHVLDDSREGDSDYDDQNQGRDNDKLKPVQFGKNKLNAPPSVNNIDLASPMNKKTRRNTLLKKQATLYTKRGSEAAPLVSKPLLQKQRTIISESKKKQPAASFIIEETVRSKGEPSHLQYNQSIKQRGGAALSRKSHSNWERWLQQTNENLSRMDVQERIEALRKRARSLRFLKKLKDSKKAKAALISSSAGCDREKLMEQLDELQAAQDEDELTYQRVKASQRRRKQLTTWYDRFVAEKRTKIQKEIEENGLEEDKADEQKVYKTTKRFHVTQSGTLRGGHRIGDPKADKELRRDCIFNLQDATIDDIMRERKAIIRWTKQLYSKDNRIILLDEEDTAKAKLPVIEEAELIKLMAESNEQIIDNQRKFNECIQEIAESPLPIQKASVLPSMFKMSTQRKSADHRLNPGEESERLKEEKRQRTLEVLDRIQRNQEMMDKLTVKEVLSRRMRLDKKANLQWKYEFKRQQNLLKKQVEISLRRERFERVIEPLQSKAGVHDRILQLAKREFKVEVFSALKKDLSAVSEHDSDVPQSPAAHCTTPRKQPAFSPTTRPVKLDEPSAAKRRDIATRRSAKKCRSLSAARRNTIDFTQIMTAMVMKEQLELEMEQEAADKKCREKSRTDDLGISVYQDYDEEDDEERRQGNSAEKRIRQFMRDGPGGENLPTTPASPSKLRGAPKTNDTPEKAFKNRAQKKMNIVELHEDSESCSSVAVTVKSSKWYDSPKAQGSKKNPTFA